MALAHRHTRLGWRSVSLIVLAAVVAIMLVPTANARRAQRPNTTISSGPASGSTIDDSTPSFSFSSRASTVAFQCDVDAAEWAGCSSPFTSATLSDGPHNFSVRAVTGVGSDSTPASRTFTVDAVADPPPPPPPAPPPLPPSPVDTIPGSWNRSASFEFDLNSEVDWGGWRVDSPFSVTRTSERGGTSGSYAAKIVTNGGNGGCSCPRMTFQEGFSYGPGSDVWISGSWLIPDPSKVAWSRLMNLGHYDASGASQSWYVGLESTNAGTFQVGYAPYTDPHVAVLPSRPIPANRWFRVDIHFRFSPTDGQAVTEWYIDGALVGSTTKANMFNSGKMDLFNAGLTYFWPGNGGTTVYFDAPRHTP